MGNPFTHDKKLFFVCPIKIVKGLPCDVLALSSPAAVKSRLVITVVMLTAFHVFLLSIDLEPALSQRWRGSERAAEDCVLLGDMPL
jgi:hypothetical protein